MGNFDSFSLFVVSSDFSSETSESMISEDCSSDVTDEASDDVFSEEVVEDVPEDTVPED